MPKTKTILWAIDPWAAGPKAAPAAISEFFRWASRQDMNVLPVYVAQLTAAERVRGEEPPLDELEGALNRIVENLGMREVRPARVVVDESSSRAGSLRELLRVAEEEEAKGIALCSQGRRGFERLMLGSFAEDLVRSSPVPIYFLAKRPAPLAPDSSNSGTVLFATDFSPDSRSAFGRFIAECCTSADRVVLFHALGFPVRYLGGEMVMVPDNYFAEDETFSIACGAEWIEEAAGVGIRAELKLAQDGSDLFTGESVLRASRETGAALVVIATSGGLMDHAFFGSVAYEVFRASTCSALVYGPRALAGEQPILRAA